MLAFFAGVAALAYLADDVGLFEVVLVSLLLVVGWSALQATGR